MIDPAQQSLDHDEKTAVGSSLTTPVSRLYSYNPVQRGAPPRGALMVGRGAAPAGGPHKLAPGRPRDPAPRH
jgi:hypothetical protein